MEKGRWRKKKFCDKHFEEAIWSKNCDKHVEEVSNGMFRRHGKL